MQSTEAGFALSLYLSRAVFYSVVAYTVLVAIPGQNGKRSLSETGNWCVDSIPMIMFNRVSASQAVLRLL